jgi:hypothetical protein
MVRPGLLNTGNPKNIEDIHASRSFVASEALRASTKGARNINQPDVWGYLDVTTFNIAVT